MKDVQQLVETIRRVKQQKADTLHAKVLHAERLRANLSDILSDLAADLNSARSEDPSIFDTFLDASDGVEVKNVTVNDHICQALYFGDLILLFRVVLDDLYEFHVSFGMTQLVAGDLCETPVFVELPSPLDPLAPLVRFRVLSQIAPYVTPK